MSGGIIWLASYPKSGNTWLRIFLANLRSGGEAPVDINDLRSSPIASARALFDDAVGLEASDLTFDEIDRLRPELYARLAAEAQETLFIKVHDAYTFVDGRPLLGGEGVLGAIYIIRNPLDVAPSFAHHIGKDLDSAIGSMGDAKLTFCGKGRRLDSQLRQSLLSWSEHVLSWTTGEKPFPVHVVSYEAMKQRPVETFGALARFAGLDAEAAAVEGALRRSDFKELQRQEQERGFKERSSRASASFFRKGQVGGWRSELTAEQAARIVAAHAEVMRRHGYAAEVASAGSGPATVDEVHE